MKITPYTKRPEPPAAWPRLRDRMDRLFQSVFAEPWREFAYPEAAGGWMPDVDVKETERTIEVRAEIPGMDPAEIPIALSPFGQVDQGLARRHEGTGLGLPLVRRMIELHQGELSISSARGMGTTATLHFPADRVVAVETVH